MRDSCMDYPATGSCRTNGGLGTSLIYSKHPANYVERHQERHENGMLYKNAL